MILFGDPALAMTVCKYTKVFHTNDVDCHTDQGQGLNNVFYESYQIMEAVKIIEAETLYLDNIEE